VPAAVDDVEAHLAKYSALFSPKHSAAAAVRVAVDGGVVAIRLPEAVHPWQLHNLAYWMLDCPGIDGDVLARSEASPTHVGYTLVRDPDLPDCLCGWDDAGEGWTVNVPDNEIVRPEAVPTAPLIAAPRDFGNWREVAVRLEDPGHEMNPRNEPTIRNRKTLRMRHVGYL
jgi:hypothetical protein